jgi:nucleotide-binding universal stress UspA family protein
VKPPFRSVFCPTDLSPVGNLAVPVAYLLAARGGVVHLARVDEPPDTGNPLYPEERPKGAPTPAEVEAAREALRGRLTALVPADAAARGVTTQVDLVEGEDVPLAIERAAKAKGADVVVLASHGRWGLSRVVHGDSVATRLLHRGDLDVIVVHSDRP